MRFSYKLIKKIAPGKYSKENLVEKLNLFSFENEGNLYIITWPHLAEIADEYTKKRASNILRKSGQSLEIVREDKIRKEKIKKEKILDAVRRFGTYSAADAKNHLGEDVWRSVQELGGWREICQSSEFRFNQLMK